MPKKNSNTPPEENKSKNSRTAKYAKAKFKEYLREEGYTEIKQINHPTDFEAYKNGIHYYFELKMTSKRDGVYFGAASITEWNAGLGDNNSELRFVIAQSKDETNDENTTFDFEPITIKTLIPYSTIPPFKINFNLPLDKNKREETMTSTRRQNKAVQLSKDLVNPLYKLHEALKDDEKRKEIIQFVEKLNNKNK